MRKKIIIHQNIEKRRIKTIMEDKRKANLKISVDSSKLVGNESYHHKSPAFSPSPRSSWLRPQKKQSSSEASTGSVYQYFFMFSAPESCNDQFKCLKTFDVSLAWVNWGWASWKYKQIWVTWVEFLWNFQNCAIFRLEPRKVSASSSPS